MEKAQKYSDVELGYLPSLPLGKAFIYNMSHPVIRRCSCGDVWDVKPQNKFPSNGINKVVFTFTLIISAINAILIGLLLYGMGT